MIACLDLYEPEQISLQKSLILFSPGSTYALRSACQPSIWDRQDPIFSGPVYEGSLDTDTVYVSRVSILLEKIRAKFREDLFSF